MKKLSVIVPCYKFHLHIEQCITSIINQKTNFDFDIIVRDDGSDDDTQHILRRMCNYYDNIIVLDSSENLGGHENIRLLMSSSNSEYLMYLDGDDYLMNPIKIQNHIDFLDSNPNFVMSSSGYCRITNTEYIPQDPDTWLHSQLEIITTSDILENNLVGFGRVFRNIPNLFKDWMYDTTYLDWAINYEISKYGLIKNENYFGGVYRDNNRGSLTSKSSDEKEIMYRLTKELLQTDYLNFSKEL